MNRLHVRTTVVGGAALGLIAGAAVFGAVSSSSAASPVPFKPALVSVDTAPDLTAAGCAAGQKLEDGVCIVHVEKAVVVPAPASGEAEAPAAESPQDTNAAGDHAAEPSEAAELSDAAEPSDAAEGTHDAAEGTHDDAEHAAELATESGN